MPRCPEGSVESAFSSTTKFEPVAMYWPPEKVCQSNTSLLGALGPGWGPITGQIMSASDKLNLTRVKLALSMGCLSVKSNITASGRYRLTPLALWLCNQTHTMRCRYNAVNFHSNPHKRHSRARPWEWGMGCLLWVQPLIKFWSSRYGAVYNIMVYQTSL